MLADPIVRIAAPHIVRKSIVKSLYCHLWKHHIHSTYREYWWLRFWYDFLINILNVTSIVPSKVMLSLFDVQDISFGYKEEAKLYFRSNYCSVDCIFKTFHLSRVCCVNICKILKSCFIRGKIMFMVRQKMSTKRFQIRYWSRCFHSPFATIKIINLVSNSILLVTPLIWWAG